MEKIPLDIILDILLSLPDQSIINCKQVCKPWRDLLRNINLDEDLLFLVRTKRYERKYRQFYHGGHQFDDIDLLGSYTYKTLAKFDNYPTPDFSCKMVGSCNGLVCFSVNHYTGVGIYDPTHICNLNTGEYVNLPTYHYYHGNFISGFGYSFSTDEYKVVRMFERFRYPSGEELSLNVQVYTLGNGLGWRDKGTENFFISKANASVCANGALHWIEIKKHKIVAFDLTHEKFILIPLPSVYSGSSGFTLKLLRGYLSVFRVDTEEKRTFVNIWSLKKKKQCNSYDLGEDEFDNHWSWNKEFSIPWECTIKYYSYYYSKQQPEICDPFAVTKSNQVILWCHRGLCCYDSKTTTFTELWDMDSWRHCIEAFPYTNCLVSLKALGEKSEKII